MDLRRVQNLSACITSQVYARFRKLQTARPELPGHDSYLFDDRVGRATAHGEHVQKEMAGFCAEDG